MNKNNLSDEVKKAISEASHEAKVAFLEWVFEPIENCEVCGGTDDIVCVCPSCDLCGEAPHEGECKL